MLTINMARVGVLVQVALLASASWGGAQEVPPGRAMAKVGRPPEVGPAITEEEWRPFQCTSIKKISPDTYM